MSGGLGVRSLPSPVVQEALAGALTWGRPGSTDKLLNRFYQFLSSKAELVRRCTRDSARTAH